MSIEASAFVLRHQVGDTAAKIILWGIADHADRYGTNSWPSHETLAEYAEVSRRTVLRKVRWLVEQGWLEVEHRSSRDGRKSNCYTILPMQPEQLSVSVSQPLSDTALSHPLSDNQAQLSDTALSQEPSVEPSPSSETTSPPQSRTPDGIRALVAHYFDLATAASRYVTRNDAPLLAKNVQEALAAGVSEADVRGGIGLLIAKGRPVQALRHLIAEYQANSSGQVRVAPNLTEGERRRRAEVYIREHSYKPWPTLEQELVQRGYLRPGDRGAYELWQELNETDPEGLQRLEELRKGLDEPTEPT